MVVRVRLRDRVCAQASVGPQHAHTWTADKDFSRSPQAVRNKTRWSQPGVAACCDCSHSFGEEHGRKDRPRTRLPRASRLASVFSGSDSRQRAHAHARARAHTHTHTHTHTYIHTRVTRQACIRTRTHARMCVAVLQNPQVPARAFKLKTRFTSGSGVRVRACVGAHSKDGLLTSPTPLL